MIYWAPILHFYQPTTQFHRILRRVCNESYRPLVSLFHKQPNAQVTVNINAVLTEMLNEHGMSDVIDGLRELSQMGRLEFLGTAKHHPIMPLIPREEMVRQIMLNNQTNRRFFGDNYSPQGFFTPELCYSQDIVEPILETGHRWIVISGIACPVAWPTNVIYQIKADSRRLSVLFRDDVLSNRISFKQIDARGFINQLIELGRKGGDIYVVTAMDAETFGHHIRHWEDLFLAEVYEALQAFDLETDFPGQATARSVEERVERIGQSADLAREHAEILRTAAVSGAGEVTVVTVSRLLELFPQGKPVEPRPSSWSTDITEIEAGNPYPLWKSRDNQIHQLQWRHVKIAIQLTEQAGHAAASEQARYYADIARGLLDRALHSDQFWWASRRPMWDINLVNRGLMQQREVVFNAYKAIKVSDLDEDDKIEAYYKVIVSRDLRSKIMDQLFMH